MAATDQKLEQELKEMEKELGQELKTAESIAEKMEASDMALTLVCVSGGKSVASDNLPDALPENVTPLPDDSPVKGLILSKEHIIKIKTYVATGLAHHTDENLIRISLGYEDDFDDKKYPHISPAAFKKLFTKMKNHCMLWSDLERDIKTTGTGLKIFGDTFITTGNNVVKAIGQMPVLAQIMMTLKDHFHLTDPNMPLDEMLERMESGKETGIEFDVQFNATDDKIRVGLADLINKMLKPAVAMRQDETKALLARLTSFRETLDNVIVPETALMGEDLRRLKDTGELADLLKKREDLKREITRLNAVYKKMVGYAMTGAAGAILGPLVVISWAITGGIFGDKAEKARKQIKEVEKELDDVNRRFNALNKLVAFASKTSDRVSNLSVVVNDAVTGVANLEVLWNAVSQYIDESAEQLAEMKDGTQLMELGTRMEAAVTAWTHVRDITGELVRLFEEAAEAARKEADRVAKQEGAA